MATSPNDLPAPDLSQVENGSFSAISDALWLMWALVNQEKKDRIISETQLAPEQTQDWLSYIGGL